MFKGVDNLTIENVTSPEARVAEGKLRRLWTLSTPFIVVV